MTQCLYLVGWFRENPGRDDDDSHRDNPRFIEGDPDFHSVPKLFKADPVILYLLISVVSVAHGQWVLLDMAGKRADMTL